MKSEAMSAWKKTKVYCKWIINNLLFFSLFAGRIAAKILDICALPEIMDLLWQRIKFNSRRLTPLEKQEARRVFGESINYSKIRIDEHSLIAWIGAKINKCSSMGVTTFHTINFNQKIRTKTGNQDMKWLIHELTHVAQMEKAGSKYFVESLYAQVTEGYAYKPGSKHHLREYNREQQASLIADYYFTLVSGSSTAIYASYIVELRAGEL